MYQFANKIIAAHSCDFQRLLNVVFVIILSKLTRLQRFLLNLCEFQRLSTIDLFYV
jgi:hypothetical protein